MNIKFGIVNSINKYLILDYGKYTNDLKKFTIGINLQRIYVFSIVNLFILTGLFIVDYKLHTMGICKNNLQYCENLLFIHLFYLTLSISFLLLYIIRQRFSLIKFQKYYVPYTNITFNIILQYIMIFSYFMIFTSLAINGQLYHGSINIYIVGTFTIATIVLLPPYGSFLIFTIIHFIFLTGIIFSQTNPKIFLDNLVNGTVAYIFSMVLNIVMTKYRAKNFINERIIKDTSEELQKKIVTIEEEIALARRIQEQLIPVNEPDQIFFSLYKPMYLIGGDFFDFVKFHDTDKTGFFISDVSGHGVPAAFITAMIKTAILQSDSIKDNPAELLYYLNDTLYDKTGGNFVTAFYGIFHSATRKLIFANAGHNEPFIVQHNKIQSLRVPKGIPLAILNNEELAKANKLYSNSSKELPQNSKLFLYTDGLLEATPLDNTISFEESGMIRAMQNNSLYPASSFVQNIYKELSLFRGQENFEDDVCLLCIDVH